MSTFGYLMGQTVGTGAAVAPTGEVLISPNVWQLVAIPAAYGEWDLNTSALVNSANRARVGSYFFDQLWDLAGRPGDPQSVIEFALAYPGDLDRNLAFIPGFTEAGADEDFLLQRQAAGEPEEVTGFMVLSNLSAAYTVSWTGWQSPP